VGTTEGALPIQAFYPFSDDYNLLPDPSFFEDYPLQNRETSWSYGALNEYRDGGNPNDFGWGVYNPATQEIEGMYVFIIEQRNGHYLKFQIQSLINGVYTFHYANLDGSGETVRTLDKADFAGKILAYFSFDTGASVDIEPSGGFDLLFCRYTTLIEAGGDTVPYLVTGILSAAGIEVAQADQVDPKTVQFQDYAESLSDSPDVIGYDWKYFDLGNFVWILSTDLVYFVKTRDDHVWKLQFVAFGGSANGNATFEKTDLGIISAVNDPISPLSMFTLYPNPAVDQVNVVYALKSKPAAEVNFQVLNRDGQIISRYNTNAEEGLNAFTIPMIHSIPGLYYIKMVIGDQSYTDRVMVTQ
jgi:hypothetical protein